MKVIYATQTGNSEELAQYLDPSAVSMADIDLEDIVNETCLFILSTWGEGEPPDDGERFFEELSSSSIDLSQTRYSICGLGDESYDIFCGFAKDVDKLLSRHGAQRITDNVYCNVEYDDDFKEWANRVTNTLYPKVRDAEYAPVEQVQSLIDDLTIINKRTQEWKWKWPTTQLDALIRALHRKM
jgi:sulfite reductase (NADPH) flavoprotein alpha-component